MNSDQLLLTIGAARHTVIALSLGIMMSCATAPASQSQLSEGSGEQDPGAAKAAAPEEMAIVEPSLSLLRCLLALIRS